MTKDPAPTINDNDCAESTLGADGWQAESVPVTDSEPTGYADRYDPDDTRPQRIYSVVDGREYPKTAACFGVNGAANFTVLYAGGHAKRATIAEFTTHRQPKHVAEALRAARPAAIPACVWGAYVSDLNTQIKNYMAKGDDHSIDFLLGRDAECLMDAAPLASALLLLARIQNRMSLNLATANHHPLSTQPGDHAAYDRAENFCFDAIVKSEWRA
jgi:hypothetical protein